MAELKAIVAKARELLAAEAVIVTACDLKDGVIERLQVYFWSENQAVMDVISKDDLVQNWPDTGVYSLVVSAGGAERSFKKVAMFEGEEDMYFRIDGTRTEADDLGALPPVAFMESVEAISQLH
jgi:hypothetical protein